jgi:hypothetical protein
MTYGPCGGVDFDGRCELGSHPCSSSTSGWCNGALVHCVTGIGLSIAPSAGERDIALDAIRIIAKELVP